MKVLSDTVMIVIVSTSWTPAVFKAGVLASASAHWLCACVEICEADTSFLTDREPEALSGCHS